MSRINISQNSITTKTNRVGTSMTTTTPTTNGGVIVVDLQQSQQQQQQISNDLSSVVGTGGGISGGLITFQTQLNPHNASSPLDIKPSNASLVKIGGGIKTEASFRSSCSNHDLFIFDI